MLRKIGKGKFSTVFLVKDKETGLLEAYKQVLKGELNSEEIRLVEKETKILNTIKNPNVVKLIDFWESFDSLNYILEYIKGDDLTNFLRKLNRPLDENEAKKITRIILIALKDIHQYGIIH